MLPDGVDHSNYDDVVQELVSPHWNSAVDILKGGDGYQTLCLLRDKLADRLSEHDRRVALESLPGMLAPWVQGILDHELKTHGRRASLGDSLDQPSSPSRPWAWEQAWSQGQHHGGYVADAKPAMLTLRSPYLDDVLKTDEERQVLRQRFAFDRNSTWAEALQSVKKSAVLYRRLPSGQSLRLRDLIGFRLEVTDHVLREYELLGHVGTFEEGQRRAIVLSAEQETFLNAALDAIAAAEADAANPKAAHKGRLSWSNVRGRMSLAVGWDTTRLENFAESEFRLFGGPAFEKQEGRGRGPLPRDEERARYERFCRVMRAYDDARNRARRPDAAQ